MAGTAIEVLWNLNTSRIIMIRWEAKIKLWFFFVVICVSYRVATQCRRTQHVFNGVSLDGRSFLFQLFFRSQLMDCRVSAHWLTDWLTDYAGKKIHFDHYFALQRLRYIFYFGPRCCPSPRSMRITLHISFADRLWIILLHFLSVAVDDVRRFCFNPSSFYFVYRVLYIRFCIRSLID